MAVQRVPRPLPRSYKFQRTTAFQFGYNSYAGFTSPSGSIVYGNGIALKYNLSQVLIIGGVTVAAPLPNFTEFTALFDRYRVNNVRLRFHYSNNVANGSTVAGTLTGAALPSIQIANDYDDATPPPANTTLMERTNTKFWLLDTNGPKSHSVKPRFAMGVQNGGSFVTGATGGNNFIDCSFPNTDYFGTKLWCETQTSPATQLQLGYIWMYATYDLEFKDPV